MHNIVIEDKRDLGLEVFIDPNINSQVERWLNWLFIHSMVECEHIGRHFAFKNDLIDHLHHLKGQNMY